MLFDIAWSELALIGAVALVVIGPKDLPKVMRQMGKWTRSVRSMAGEFQRHVEDMVRESELEEIRREAEAAAKAADMGDIGASIEKTIDAKGIEDALKGDEAAGAATAAPPDAPASPVEAHTMLPEGHVPPPPPAPEGTGAAPSASQARESGEHEPAHESAAAPAGEHKS